MFTFYPEEPDAFPIRILTRRLLSEITLKERQIQATPYWEMQDHLIQLMRWSAYTGKPIPAELKPFFEWFYERTEASKHF